jgi:hypothetical protein
MARLREIFGLSETPEEMGEVMRLESELFDALQRAGMCPGCWYEDMQKGALADHDENCHSEFPG